MLSQRCVAKNASETFTKKNVIFKYASTGDLYNLKRILFEGINKNNNMCIKDLQGCNLLHRALENCENDSCVQFLIEIAPQMTKERNSKGETPLMHACNLIHMNIETLQLIVKTDPSSINVPDNNECTPLHKVSAGYSTRHDNYYNVHSDTAKKSRYLDRAIFLIENGIQINFEDTNGFSALHYAIQMKSDDKFITDMKMIELLVKYGGKFYTESGKNSLILAKNSYQIMEYILKQDPSCIDSVDSNGLTPLNYFLKYNSSEVNNKDLVTLLLTSGAKVDSKTINMARRFKNSFSVIKTLLSFSSTKYDMETRDEEGRTLLIQYAILEEDVRHLLQQGANVNAVDNYGSNALFTAVSQSKVSISLVKLLLEAGVNPLQIDKNNRNILSLACENFTSNPTEEDNLFKVLVHLLNLPCFINSNVTPPSECNNEYHPQYIILNKLNILKYKINAYKILELILKSNWKNSYLEIVSYVENFENTLFLPYQKLNPLSCFLNTSIDILINANNKNLLKKEVINILNLMINFDFIKKASKGTVSPLSIILSVIHQIPLISAIYHINDNEEENYRYMAPQLTDSDSDDDIEYDLDFKKKLQESELINWVHNFIEHKVNVEDMSVELEINTSDEGIVNLRRLLWLPDALWISFLRNNLESVKILLPYWSQPPLALFLFQLNKDYNDIMKFMPLFLQYGGIPHGTQISKHLKIFMISIFQKYNVHVTGNDACIWKTFNEIMSSPASLRDLSRHAVRISLAPLASKSGVSLPELLADINPPPGLKEYLLMQ